METSSKQAFFGRLDRLAGDDSDSSDTSPNFSFDRVEFTRISQSSERDVGDSQISTDQYIAAVESGAGAGKRREAGRQSPSSNGRKNIAPTTSEALPTYDSVAAFRGDVPRAVKGLGKKKRGKSEVRKLVPEKQRIFQGLAFYFFPSDDTQATISQRILLAIDYGAKWTRLLRPFVTHVIVADGLSKAELDRFVGLEKIPNSAHIVHDKFMYQSITMQTLLDPRQYKTLIPGFEAAKRRWSDRELSPTSPESSRSLKVKASKSRAVEETPRKQDIASQDESSPEKSSHSPLTQIRTSQARVSSECDIGKDDLDHAIRETKKNPQFLIDTDDEDAESGASSSSKSRSDVARKEYQTRLETMTNSAAWQKSFACMQSPSARQAGLESPNAPVIRLLEEMASYYDGTRDEWRVRAYRIGINALKKHPHEIKSAQEALRLPGIGRRLAAKIEEIKWTSRLRRLENAKLDETDVAMGIFTSMYGVGPALAHQWVSRGLRTLEDLETHSIELTKNQRIGLERHADFSQRIPRDEVTLHASIVTKALHKIDSAFTVVVSGSYRRGSPTCGDIDLLITHPTSSLTYTRTVVLETLIPRLTAKGFLVAALAVSSNNGTKWHGASQAPPDPRTASPRPWRRIDFLLVPADEWGAALAYFTGNDVFNRSMRLLARRKGMCLNQHGLFKDIIRGPGQAKMNKGTKIAGADEREIFDLLGVPWRDCAQRDA